MEDELKSTSDKESLKTRSHVSHSSKSARLAKSSRSSTATSVSMAATTARAEANAAQPRAAFSQRELDIKIEKTRIEARMDALQHSLKHWSWKLLLLS